MCWSPCRQRPRRQLHRTMTKLIEDYGLIGDCETAALVSRAGSVDWLCWPRFDSGAVFAALLGGADNGHWSIRPSDPAPRVHRRYRGNTLILETTFETAGGSVTLTDFMPLRERGTSHLIRIVRGQRGQVKMTTELMLRFDYGAVVPWVTRLDDQNLQAIAGPDMVVLYAETPIDADGFRHRGDFTVAAGEQVAFSLRYGPSYLPAPPAIDALEALEVTQAAWERWSSPCGQSGNCSEEVLRSAITLKALTYRPTGGIVAAPTTSLPEALGGVRNWDYRYCWLRDATFTLMALMNAGFHQEAAAWRAWLRRAVAGDPAQVQIMYGLAGERRLDEWLLPWLPGYKGSNPVRIGNAAAGQLQIDIYGEVLDALYQASVLGLGDVHVDWDLQSALIQHLVAIWKEPDDGIWEVRSERRHFTHSKVMAWVAFDRAIKSVERYRLPGPADKWRAARDEIHREVCEKGFNATLGAFVQSYGSDALDASTLLIPLVGFLPPSDPRVKSTVAAIERDLTENGLVLRYRHDSTDDGLPGGEGVFLACSFWLVDNYVLLGRHEEARTLFGRLLSLRNDLGLLAEQYDAVSGRMLGNFPQAFSHIALINSAHNLWEREKPAEKRSGHASPRESIDRRTTAQHSPRRSRKSNV
jgi:GH15 family glucan-1,4-alpha-glucosidase